MPAVSRKQCFSMDSRVKKSFPPLFLFFPRIQVKFAVQFVKDISLPEKGLYDACHNAIGKQLLCFPVRKAPLPGQSRNCNKIIFIQILNFESFWFRL